MFRFVVLLFTLLFVIPVVAQPRLTKAPQTFGLMLKSYSVSSAEDITLYGALRRHLVGRYWCWGEFGDGAVMGKRSGYLEGGVLGGAIVPFSETWSVDSKVMIGAGGGGGAPQGGGLIVNPSIGVIYYLNKRWFLQGDLGYIRFLNGDIESMTAGFGLHAHFWKIGVAHED